jgi:hypothetical protein
MPHRKRPARSLSRIWQGTGGSLLLVLDTWDRGSCLVAKSGVIPVLGASASAAARLSSIG